MSKRAASIISYLFHPLLFPTYGAALIIAANPHMFAAYHLKGQILWVIITFIFTFICPVVWLLMMKKLELISDLKMDNQRERIIPFVAVVTFYLWMFKLFKPTGQYTPYSNSLISTMMLGASVAISIGFFINIFRKISLHAIGAGAFLGLILCLMNQSDFDLKFLFIFALLLAGVIGTARLVLDAHKQNEIIMGYAAGFFGQFFSFILLPYLLR